MSLVIDSVAALVPRAEIEGDMGDSVMGLQARLMSQALRKLTAVISKSKNSSYFYQPIKAKNRSYVWKPRNNYGGTRA